MSLLSPLASLHGPGLEPGVLIKTAEFLGPCKIFSGEVRNSSAIMKIQSFSRILSILDSLFRVISY